MTAFMPPVNEAFNPLPTRVLYNWKSDQDYEVTSDRITSKSALLKKPEEATKTPITKAIDILVNN